MTGFNGAVPPPGIPAGVPPPSYHQHLAASIFDTGMGLPGGRWGCLNPIERRD